MKSFKYLKPYGVFVALAGTLLLFQNCGKIAISPLVDRVDLPSMDAVGTSYLQIPPTEIQEFRALFVIDMSDSMYQGVCIDTVDTWIENVDPTVPCLGPTGADPEGKRYQLILNWIQELRELIQDGKIQSSKVKMAFLPFAGGAMGIAPGIDLDNSYSVLRKTLGQLGVPYSGFIDIEKASQFAETLWAIEMHHRRKNYPPQIRSEVIDAVEAQSYNSVGSTGTSIPLKSLEKSATYVASELQRLGGKKSNFEVVFLSDGVPKPHAKHIKKVVEKIWEEKSLVCDPTGIDNYYKCSNMNAYGYTSYYTGQSEPVAGWHEGVNGVKCVERCGSYLETYIATGGVQVAPQDDPVCTSFSTSMGYRYGCERYSDGSSPSQYWGVNIKCGACFKLLKQYDYYPANSQEYTHLNTSTDYFRDRVKKAWGDWLDNHHVRIISPLRSIDNLFKKQYPGNRYKFNFLRIESSNYRFQTQPGELVKDLNWFERSKEVFDKVHRHAVITSSTPKFSLFSDLSKTNEYKIGQVYSYVRNFRSDKQGQWHLDLDRDGLVDSTEPTAWKNKKRSNGYCMDIIMKKYSNCVQTCNPQIDFDRDGLNQCEELTIGTSDFDPDSDGDGILDEAEVLMGFNPSSDDSKIYLSGDRLSNYEHFLRGYSPDVDLRNIPLTSQIKISTEIADYKWLPNAMGYDVLTPGYQIQIQNIPKIEHPEFISPELVVILRVENKNDGYDKKWLMKVYELETNQKSIAIDFQDFTELDLRSP